MLNKNLFFAMLVAAYSAHLFADVVEITTQADFNNKVKNASGLVVVKASATWCGPCKQLAPELKKISGEYKDVAIYEVDDKNNAIVREFGVQGYPTTLFFVNGKKVDSVVGSRPDAIRSKIDQYKSGAAPVATKAAPVMQAPVAAAPAVKPAPVAQEAQPVKQTRRHGRAHGKRSSKSCGSCATCK